MLPSLSSSMAESEAHTAGAAASIDGDDAGARCQRLKRSVPRIDSLDVEAMQVPGIPQVDQKDHTLWITLPLVFQTIGVVYGDLGTSPLYVYSSAFHQSGIDGKEDILGALSIIIYTLTIISLFKYVVIVLRASNNGEGGTFSLYSMICRFAKINLIPNREPSDEELSNFKIQVPTKRLERALEIKEKLEKHFFCKNLLLILVLFGSSLIVGDGMLTPCISVMSAVSGLKVVVPYLTQDGVVVISLVILVLLFNLQRFGTGKVGLLFGPILSVWFAAIAVIGLYNILKYDPGVVRAFNPACIYLYFKKDAFRAWCTLAGLVLCITGAEAIFADVGHFSVKAIQLAFSFVVYPSLLLAYMGQAAYLVKHPYDVGEIFYKSIPAALSWPVLIVAILAAMIASQAMISATFSVVKMALAMDCFPRVKVVHTSKRFRGQIYIPVINWFLMIMSLILIAFFQNTAHIGHAYGIMVVGDMLVTTSLMTLIMLMIWQKSLALALGFLLFFGSAELLYLSSLLYKAGQGGWLPVALTMAIPIMMYIWHYGLRMKYQCEVEQRISMEYMLQLGSSLGTIRVPGLGLLYTDLVRGVPAVFGYFIQNLPAIHSTIIFVCIKYVPVPVVPQSERFLFRRVCPRDFHLFRCIARYGYKDIRKEDHYIFEQLLIESLEAFIHREAQECSLENESFALESDYSDDDFCNEAKSLPSTSESLLAPLLIKSGTPKRFNSFARAVERSSLVDFFANAVSPADIKHDHDYIDSIAANELAYLHEAKEAGVVYLLCHADVRAKKESIFFKKLVINYFHSFLARNCRASTETLSVPHMNLLEVGMTYMV